MLPELETLRSLVTTGADEVLMPYFTRVERSIKADGSLLTAADMEMQTYMQQALGERWPEYAFLGEEMGSEEQQHLLDQGGAGLWCLDPLDGTSNYAAGIPFFAVSLALLVKGEPVLGLVYDPVRRECFMAQKGQGAWLNGERLGQRLPQPPLKHGIGVVDFKRLPADLAKRLAEAPPYSSQRSFGSVALDWAWLAAGRYHVYLHGKQRLWDFAAGSLIFAEAGGHACTLEGERVYQPTVEPRSALGSLHPDLFAEWKACLGIA